MKDRDALRQASASLHQLALWLDLQADRLELGTPDDETDAAIEFARKLTGSDDERESPCG